MRRRSRVTRVWVLAWLLAFAPVAAGVGAGCATKTTTVTRERAGGEGETVVTETTEVDRPTGVLSTTLNFIGEVIALPFRLVAGVVQLIF